MRHAWANVALLVLVVAATATGLGGLLVSDRDGAIVFWLHALAAWSIVGLLVVKGRVIWAAIGRRPRVTVSRVAFLVLLALLLAVLATGVAWVLLDGYRRLGYFSLINVHAYLAIALTLLLVWHVLARRRVFRGGAARTTAPRSCATPAPPGWASCCGAPSGWWRPRSGPRGAGASRAPTSAARTRRASPRCAGCSTTPTRSTGRLAADRGRRGASAPSCSTAPRWPRCPPAARRAILDCTGGWWCEQDWDGVPCATCWRAPA